MISSLMRPSAHRYGMPRSNLDCRLHRSRHAALIEVRVLLGERAQRSLGHRRNHGEEYVLDPALFALRALRHAKAADVHDFARQNPESRERPFVNQRPASIEHGWMVSDARPEGGSS